MRSTRAMGGAVKRAGAGRGWRRAVLGALALGALAAPAIGSGCVAGFDPPSQVDGLRVFAVVADKPYALPGDDVTFTIHYQDASETGGLPVTVFWFGGCENPIGDDYYGCYPQIAGVAPALRGSGLGDLPIEVDGIRIDAGDRFTVKIGEDILDGRKPPASGPAFGSAYVFFVACAGIPGLVEDEGTGRAGSFPVGCFDAQGRRLGADSFVPGYTQVYVFEDDRDNKNPAMQGLTLDGEGLTRDGEPLPLPEDFADIPTVKRCPIGAEERREVGCSAPDPRAECATYTLDALIPEEQAEPDPDAKQRALKEILWVDYFADLGDLDPGIKLVSDAERGYTNDHAVTWIPPAEPGVATLTAVLRDTRGGSSVVQRRVRVE